MYLKSLHKWKYLNITVPKSQHFTGFLIKKKSAYPVSSTKPPKSPGGGLVGAVFECFGGYGGL